MTGRPEEAEVQRAKRSMAALKVELPEGVWITHEEAMRPLFLAVAAQGRVIEAARRELERASDVRANRTRIIGNAHLILQGACSADPKEQTTS